MAQVLLNMSRVNGYMANPTVKTPGYRVKDRLSKCRVETSTHFSLHLGGAPKGLQAYGPKRALSDSNAFASPPGASYNNKLVFLPQ